MAESHFSVKKCTFVKNKFFSFMSTDTTTRIFFTWPNLGARFPGLFRTFCTINEHLGPSGWLCRSYFVFSDFWRFGAKWSVHMCVKMPKSPKSTCPTSDHHEFFFGDIWISFLGARRKNIFFITTCVVGRVDRVIFTHSQSFLSLSLKLVILAWKTKIAHFGPPNMQNHSKFFSVVFGAHSDV